MLDFFMEDTNSLAKYELGPKSPKKCKFFTAFPHVPPS
jgi:hypothetical protein